MPPVFRPGFGRDRDRAPSLGRPADPVGTPPVQPRPRREGGTEGNPNPARWLERPRIPSDGAARERGLERNRDHDSGRDATRTLTRPGDGLGTPGIQPAAAPGSGGWRRAELAADWGRPGRPTPARRRGCSGSRTRAAVALWSGAPYPPRASLAPPAPGPTAPTTGPPGAATPAGAATAGVAVATTSRGDGLEVGPGRRRATSARPPIPSPSPSPNRTIIESRNPAGARRGRGARGGGDPNGGRDPAVESQRMDLLPEAGGERAAGAALAAHLLPGAESCSRSSRGASSRRR